MVRLSKSDLELFKVAILKDYGVTIPDEELYQSAFNLLNFIESLIKLSQETKAKKETN